MRARNIKPGFYKNEDLAECSVWGRLLAPGLWMMADRKGLLEDRPKRIKGEIFPFDSVDVDELLNELDRWGHIKRYEVDGVRYIKILAFEEHQTPHVKEKQSEFPDWLAGESDASTRQAPDKPGAKQVLAPPDSLIPDSLIPDSLIPDSTASAVLRASELEKTDFQKIYDAGCAVFPLLATANTSSIHQWIAAGCNAELDVIPEIQRLARADKAVRAWSYFSGGVMDAMAKRTTPLPQGRANGYGQKPAESDEEWFERKKKQYGMREEQA